MLEQSRQIVHIYVYDNAPVSFYCRRRDQKWQPQQTRWTCQVVMDYPPQTAHQTPVVLVVVTVVLSQNLIMIVMTAGRAGRGNYTNKSVIFFFMRCIQHFLKWYVLQCIVNTSQLVVVCCCKFNTITSVTIKQLRQYCLNRDRGDCSTCRQKCHLKNHLKDILCDKNHLYRIVLVHRTLNDAFKQENIFGWLDIEFF